MKTVVLGRIARQEIEAAATLHEKQKPGLGVEFSGRVAEAAERIGIAIINHLESVAERVGF